jgi:hypothetical protein
MLSNALRITTKIVNITHIVIILALIDAGAISPYPIVEIVVNTK